ncbi:CobW family GTP-binding protein [Paenibacillus physcomitrellae]|uniref:G3E family GTPase n=1 Tax=Paenibacillus physcomitrellae TaxID=1619311 RepID=A0ABQ1GK89_9BACL|nr:GTP-binding protein [Paenibacillus physcomitrellae]GGA45476.1 G3E family GTPase [Paenibacillus physcomitrellae]
MDNKTPVIVLSGFLGSGKTTLLIKLLLEARRGALKPGILMNELGRQDVDGLILNEETGFSIEKLLDGCVCCSKKEDLARSLLTLLYTRPDLLLIELTGVANPVEIASLLSQPPFAERLTVKHSITVMDAEHALDYSSLFASDKQLVRTLRQQVEAADLVLVNKTDLASQTQVSKVLNLVHRYNPKTAVQTTQKAEIDVRKLLEGIPSTQQLQLENKPPYSAQRELRHSSHGTQHLHVIQQHPQQELQQKPQHVHDYQHEHQAAGSEAAHASFSAVQTFTLPCSAERSFSREELEHFLAGLSGQIVRAKGYVKLEGEGTTLIQYAGGRFSYEASRYPGSGYIVIIGLHVHPDESAEQWERLIRQDRIRS